MISVVIPAHDEERYVGRTLATLRAATPFEVLVVANACRDRTADVARAAGAAVLRTSVRGVSHARNLGARASRGELLLFLDADTTLAPGALDAIAAAVPARADYGTCRIRSDRTTLAATLTTTLLAWGHRLAGTSLGVLFCARSLFDRSGGFDEDLHAGEDNDLNARFHRAGARRIYLGGINAYTSMRRFERLGYARVHLAWLGGYFRPPAEYEVIR
ncbi:MAG: glycosyltransferase [Deltaproteobacteria bacterium]|nr:MAG: glycosyltransferase [Deltaproteobacteria bacterium]